MRAMARVGKSALPLDRPRWSIPLSSDAYLGLFALALVAALVALALRAWAAKKAPGGAEAAAVLAQLGEGGGDGGDEGRVGRREQAREGEHGVGDLRRWSGERGGARLPLSAAEGVRGGRARRRADGAHLRRGE